MLEFSGIEMTKSEIIRSLALLSLLTVAQCGCPPEWNLKSDGHCYEVFTDQALKSAYDARYLCQEHGADLASFPDQGQRPSLVYIGAVEISDTMQWIDNSTYNDTLFPSSANLPQIEDYNDGQCVALNSTDLEWPSDGQNVGWARVPCCFQDQPIDAVVCKKAPDDNITITNDVLNETCFGGCNEGWNLWNGTCYSLVSSSPQSMAYKARQTCYNKTSDLPSIDDDETVKHIINVIRAADESASAIYTQANDVPPTGTYDHLESGVRMDRMSNDVHSKPGNCLLLSPQDGTWSPDAFLLNSSCCEDVGVSSIVCAYPVDGSFAPENTDVDFTVVDCDTEACLSSPCVNGTCEELINDFRCDCVEGYGGKLCDSEIDNCDSDPCMNGATCTSTADSYECFCPHGYTGSSCETIFDECVSTPCQNNATCVDGDEHYNCTCMIGFTGVHCEENIDDCSNVTCHNNATCQDGVNSWTCVCKPGFSGQLCSDAITCDADIEVGNATKRNESNPNAYGGWMTFVCNRGYKFSDMTIEKNYTCLSAGFSPPLIGDCEQHCDYVPIIQNAVALSPNTRVGNTVNYTCNYGYQFPDNSTEFNITCVSPGNWTEDVSNISHCEIVTCPELTDYPHQEVDTYNNTYDTTVTFWCDVGYVLFDNTTARTIKCLANGKWTAELPPCDPVLCPVIPSHAYQTRNTSKHEYDTYARFDCTNKKRMLDGSTYRIIKCDATAEWSDNITDCTADRCFPLPYVANATPSTTDADFGTESTLTCIRGHRFNPGKKSERKMACNSDGWWHPILTHCDPILCDPVPKAVNIEPSTENQLFGTIVDYKCLKGHYIDPIAMSNSLSIECLETEVWNFTNIPDCWPIQCPQPADIVNGTRQLPDPAVFNYTDLVHYDCDDGFKFIDGRTKKNLLCNEYGDWNETDVSCRKERCDPVPLALNTVPDTYNTSWYTNVTYSCAVGHEWPANKTTHEISCKVGGEWTESLATIPPCDIKVCPPLEPMGNATINATDVLVYNTYVSYDCDIGFKYEDGETSKLRWCTENAVWAPSQLPECHIIICPDLMDVENATRDSNATHYDTVVTYNCDEGYQYPDKSLSQSIQCLANGTWTEYPPPCEVVFCPPVPYWDEADFNSSDNSFLAVVSYQCHVNYSFADAEGSNNVEKIATCLESKVWDPPFDDCQRTDAINADLQGKTWESPKAVSIGTIACSIMGVVFGLMVLLDLNKIWMDLQMMRANIKSLINFLRPNKVSASQQCIKNAVEESP